MLLKSKNQKFILLTPSIITHGTKLRPGASSLCLLPISCKSFSPSVLLAQTFIGFQSIPNLCAHWKINNVTKLKCLE